jgi:hypothetical protein
MKWFALIALSVLFQIPDSSAQCVNGNCRDGLGTFIYKSGSRYEGQFADGNRNGKGIMYFVNGDMYRGSWADDKINGYGRYIAANGETYEGNFKNDRPHGQGRLTKPDKSIQTGTWANGVYQNKQPPSGRENNSEESASNSRLSSNPTYQASARPVSNSQPSEALSDCTFGNCNNIRGIYNYRDGSKYEGMFQGGKPEGEGVCYYHNGDRYVGNWSKHAPHGKGILYYKDGNVAGGTWHYGRLVDRTSNDYLVMNQEVDRDNDKSIKVWAVIIGIGRYSHMQTLKYSDDDAYQIYAFLKSPEGGAVPDKQIKLLIDDDATRLNILDALRQTLLKADENDVVMIYYSGHGMDGAFVPIDFDGFNNLIRHEEVKSVLNQSQAKHKIVFADACHSGSMMLAARGSFQTSVNKFYDAFAQSSGGIALLMSSKGEETSLEANNLRQGVFSHFLIRGLKGEADKNHDKLVTISELYNFVYGNVTNYSAHTQTPTLTGSFDPNMPVAVMRY